jgi:hypothetical protein
MISHSVPDLISMLLKKKNPFSSLISHTVPVTISMLLTTQNRYSPVWYTTQLQFQFPCCLQYITPFILSVITLSSSYNLHDFDNIIPPFPCLISHAVPVSINTLLTTQTAFPLSDITLSSSINLHYFDNISTPFPLR